MTAVPAASPILGASLGVSGIRAVIMDPAGSLPTTDMFVDLPGHSKDPWDAVTSTVVDLARDHAPSATPVLALRDKNPVEAYGVEMVDGVGLVSDVGAQISGLVESGDLVGEGTIALFDVGAGGVTVSIVDCRTGRIHASRRSAVLSGDGCDATLTRALMQLRGLGLAPAPEVEGAFIDRVCAAKERLSLVTSVEVELPLRGGVVVLSRRSLDDLVRESVYDAVTLAVAMIEENPRVDALYAVGGGANMQIVRQSLFDALTVPVFVPPSPELLAATGAAVLARGLAEQRAAAIPTARPRHSDTSSGRLTRLKQSRYLGGAAAFVVAGGIALSVAAAANTGAPEPVYAPASAPTSARPGPSVAPAAATPAAAPSGTSTAPSDTATTTTDAPVTEPGPTSTSTQVEATTTRATRTTIPATTTTPAPTTTERERDSTTRAPTQTSTPQTTPQTTPRPTTSPRPPTR